MKNKLLSILLHPGFIASVISLVIIYFLPDYFTKYKVEFVHSELFLRKNHKVYFEDLSNDSNSESIFCYENSLGNACFEIHNPNGSLVDQWNFSNKHTSLNKYLWFFKGKRIFF